MPSFHRFLLVDDVAENRFLISKALLKAFSDAVVLECQDSSTAMAVICHENCSIVIIHRAQDLDGASFIDVLRRYCPRMPVVLISEELPVPEAVKSGASAVVSWNAWQTIGSVCADIIAKSERHWRSVSTSKNFA
jgi:CheY-like chemotaxis protein